MRGRQTFMAQPPTLRRRDPGRTDLLNAGIPVTYVTSPEEIGKIAARAVNLELIRDHCFGGSVAALSARTEMSIERLRDLMDGDARFDAATAEHLERTMGLPAGWLDQQRSGLSKEEVTSLRACLGLNAAEAAPLAGESIAQAPQTAWDTAVSPEDVEAEAQTVGPMISASDSAPSSDDEDFSPVSAPTTVEAPKGNAMPKLSDPFLIALDQALQEAPHGSRSRFARHAGRNPSDLSAWLRGLRPAPAAALQAMREALETFDPDVRDRVQALLSGVQPQTQEPVAVQPSAARVVESAAQPKTSSEHTAPAVSQAKAADASAVRIEEINRVPSLMVSRRTALDDDPREAKIVETLQEAVHVLSILVERRARRD